MNELSRQFCLRIFALMLLWRTCLGQTAETDASDENKSTIAVKIKTEDINVVEDERLIIKCSVLGDPNPVLSWRIETGNYNGTFNNRVKIQDYNEDGKIVENGTLIIEKINKGDRGEYICIGTNQHRDQDKQESRCLVRVTSKYAALWPFLGILAEVIVLGAILIVHEKKHSSDEVYHDDE